MDVDRNGAHDDATLIRERIAETRQDISATVEALAYKTDVPARAQDALLDGLDSAKETVGLASDVAASVVATVPKSTRKRAVRVGLFAIVAIAIAVVVLRRRSSAAGEETDA